MFEFVDFLDILSDIDRLWAFSFVKLKLCLTFFKSLSELIMYFFHFSDMYFFIYESFL